MNQVTCKACGWVHFHVSRKNAELEVKSFNEYFDTLPERDKQDYYGNRKSNIRIYEKCGYCGGSYKNFRESNVGDCSDGCTIGPIIDRED